MTRSTFCWLLALGCLLVFLGLEPLLSFALFGSDTGEYFRLTAQLVSSGHFAASFPTYQGWGTAYPDFPGLFALAAAAAGALGVDPLSALLYVVPAVAALSVFPLFLLFRRLFGHELVALVAAGFAGVAMPRLFILGHPAPQALGDFLVAGALWMYVEGRTDRRWYVPLALTSGALIVTHHLSSYFFLLAALGGLFLLELWRPRAWSRRFPQREFVFLGVFVVALLAYWFYAAPRLLGLLASSFHGSLAVAPPLAMLGGALGVLAVALVSRWRRHRAPAGGGRVRFPSDASTVREIGIIAGGTIAGLAALLVLPLPPGNQHVTPGELAFFAPYYLPIALTAGTRRLTTLSRSGPFAVAWLGALAASVGTVLLASALGPPVSSLSVVLVPGRHVEFLAVPLAFLLALGVGRWVARLGARRGRGAVVASGLAVALLMTANAAIAYPPPTDFGGFQEGLTTQDQSLWLWAGVAVPPGTSVATDHRLSSMLFGFARLNGTWANTPCLFLGSNFTTTASCRLGSCGSAVPAAPDQELRRCNTPIVYRPVEAVAVDQAMYGGVALDPANLALPLSPAAQHWFESPPFVRLYLNGAQAVYWVDFAALP